MARTGKENTKAGYDISKIENIFKRMIASDTFPTQSMLNDLQKELNKFFDKAKCNGVLFTRNTDNLFFGMIVMPNFSNETTLDIVLNNNPIRVESYYIEIDSKLFTLGLEADEMCAVLLHEIGHMVLDDMPVKKVRYAIDKYFTHTDDIINIKSSAQYTQILKYAVKDTMIKATSLRFADDDEVKADMFVAACGYGEQLVSAQNKIISNIAGLTRSARVPKLTILQWIFNLYKNVKFNRIPAINVLKDAKKTTGSVLTKKELDSVINALQRIDTDVITEGAILTEAAKRGLAAQLKINGLKGILNDYYEFQIRAKGITTENDQLYLMRQINARMSLLQDAIYENDMTEAELKKWRGVLEDYENLRKLVANKKISTKLYGLWYDYSVWDDEQMAKSMYGR